MGKVLNLAYFLILNIVFRFFLEVKNNLNSCLCTEKNIIEEDNIIQDTTEQNLQQNTNMLAAEQPSTSGLQKQVSSKTGKH